MPQAEEECRGDELGGDGAPCGASCTELERANEHGVKDQVCERGEGDGEHRRGCVFVCDESRLENHGYQRGGVAERANGGVGDGALRRCTNNKE